MSSDKSGAGSSRERSDLLGEAANAWNRYDQRELFHAVPETKPHQLPPSKSLTPIKSRLVERAAAIEAEPPERFDFLHAVLCQVGMPRQATPARIFERYSGNASMILEAGRLWRGGHWVEQPLPYGTRPRLVMVHITSEAIKQKTRTIEVGDSVREFLIRLGIDTNGGPRGGYTMLGVFARPPKTVHFW